MPEPRIRKQCGLIKWLKQPVSCLLYTLPKFYKKKEHFYGGWPEFKGI